MSAIIVIPARHASSRLPGKPLLKETGKYLIQHVYERACQSRRASAVVVATDDSRIVSAVTRFGGRVVMTRRDHPSGTDRVAEVARKMEGDLIVNLQGDEPLIEPDTLDLLIGLLERDSAAEMATLACPIWSEEQWHNPNCVKVVCDDACRALYFSRSPIPFVRDGKPDFTACPPRFLQHIGLYGYRQSFLLRYACTPPGELEKLEKLEQLRALGLGCRIPVGVVGRPTRGVDTYDDYRRFVEEYRSMRTRRAA
jgi:3-deoxy-manno-octulosonate cytidylyltransferase (CMP-KDO synthetase)